MAAKKAAYFVLVKKRSIIEFVFVLNDSFSLNHAI